MPARRTLLRLGTLLSGCLPALIDPGAVQRAAGLEELARSEHPYFVAAHFGLLYLWAPLVALSGCLLFLTPGLLLAWAFGAAADIGRWILYGLGLSLVVVSSAAAMVQTALGHALVGTPFAMVVLVCALLSAGVLIAREARGARQPCSLDQRATRPILITAIAVPWLLVACLAPKFYWEGFNGDGVHAFEATRLLLSRALPFWDRDAGPISFYPGVTSMLFTFPGAWFLRLYGLGEAAARLPVLLYLIAVFAGIVAIAENRRGPLPAIDAVLIWVALAIYLVVMAFSASYDAYSADIALPATQDTLLVACLLGFVLAWAHSERFWSLLFLLLTYVSLPSGFLLILMFVAAAWLVEKPRPWSRAVWSAAGVVGCIVLAAVLARVLDAFHLPLPGGEYGKESLLERFTFLQFTDTQRFLFVLIPCGAVPAIALFHWRSIDPLARAIALTLLGYFALFFVQAYISLHHFVPAMLLPLAVFWRSRLVSEPKTRPWMLCGVAIGALACLFAALPKNATVAMHGKDIGRTIEMRVAGYAQSAPAAFACVSLLGELFSTGIDAAVPEQKFGGSPNIWNYYAQHAAQTAREVNYVVQRADEAAPADMQKLSEKDGFALFVRDTKILERQRGVRPPAPPGSALLAEDRGLLFFGQRPRQKKLYILNVRSALRRLGL